MTKALFVAATGQHCGKTTLSLSLLHLARDRYRRVGFLKPVGQEYVEAGGLEVDKDAALMAEVFDLRADLGLMSPVLARHGYTKDMIDHPERRAAEGERMLQCYRALRERCDFLVVEGTGHGGVGSVFGWNNAQVARLLGVPVMVVGEGGIGSFYDALSLNVALYQRHGAEVRMALANKLVPDKRAGTLAYLAKACEPDGVRVLGGLDYSPVLANPTLDHVSRLFRQPLRGSPEDGRRIAHHIQLGAASTQRVVDLLQPASLLIVTSTRDELIVTLSSLYHMPEYRERVAGCVVVGVVPLSKVSQKILDDSGMPYLRVEKSSAEVFARLRDYVSKLAPDDEEKIRWIKRASEISLDFDAIDARL